MTILRRRIGSAWRTLSGAPQITIPPGKTRFLGAVAPSASAASISWLRPFDGGSPITGYRLTVTPGGAIHDFGPEVNTATIAGLTNLTAYQFSIHATNAVGPGAESDLTVPVTPTAAALIRRTAANTGPLGVFDATLGRNLSYADLTTYTGPATLTTPGATYHRMSFTAPPVVAADNITFNQCRIKVANSWLYALRRGATTAGAKPIGLKLIDSEIDGSGTDWDGVTVDGSQPGHGDAPSAAIEPGLGFTMQRCRVHSCGDLLKPHDNPEADPILIEDSLLDRPTFPRGAHADILQIAGNGAYNVTVRRSTLDGLRTDIPYAPKRLASSSLVQFGSFPKAADGTPKAIMRNLIFEDLYVDGGTYAARLSIGKTGAAECTNVVFRRIRFGLNHQYGAFTPPSAAADGSKPVFEDCVWDATGTLSDGTAVLAGQEVL